MVVVFPAVFVIAALAGIAVSMIPAESESNSFENVTGGVDYFHYSGRDDQASYNAYKFRMGSNVFNDNVSVDLSTEFGDEEDAPNSYNQLEAGVRGVWQFPYSDVVGLYGRAAIGQMWNSGESNFPYWSVEPGVELYVSENVKGNVGYRYRNAFDDEQYAFETNAALVGVEWMVMKNHGVNVGYEYSGKDQKYDMLGIGYTYSF